MKLNLTKLQEKAKILINTISIQNQLAVSQKNKLAEAKNLRKLIIKLTHK